jgi:WD repeat-containing protein 23
MGHVKKAVQRKPRTTRPIPGRAPLAATASNDEDDDDDDYEDEDDMPWGGFGNRARNAPPHEDSSMKKIKTVQGEEGRWTVTDCDADKKAEK